MTPCHGEDVMLKTVRARLTYANVMATLAVFLGLAGGAYALSGVPDRGGVYRACVDDKTGALRVVAKAASCRKATTVKRGKRRVRIPGESAIAWNQQGPPGIQGVQGVQGVGKAGATNVTVRQSASGTGDVTATCDPGERAVGGGANAQPSAAHIYLSLPVDSTNLAATGHAPTGWRIRAEDNAGTPASVTAFVVCASP
jgi:hypothetical protein